MPIVLFILQQFDLTASLEAVSNTTLSQDILMFVLPLVAVIAIILMAIRGSVVMAAIMAASTYFAADAVCGGLHNLKSMPVPILILGCAVLVAITAFWPRRPARSMYR